MDIKELRIGNLIERNGVIAKIELINNEIDEVYFIGEDFYYNDFCCNINPIELTEDLLLNFGFRTEENYCFELDNIAINTKRELMWIYTKCRNNVELMMPEYVHQIQNIYFDLTGCELTIKK